MFFSRSFNVFGRRADSARMTSQRVSPSSTRGSAMKTAVTGTYATSPDLTWYPLSEALDLLKAAGFVDVHAHSDFTFEPATDADTSYIVLGNRP
jgi:hypothetical protein